MLLAMLGISSCQQDRVVGCRAHSNSHRRLAEEASVHRLGIRRRRQPPTRRPRTPARRHHPLEAQPGRPRHRARTDPAQQQGRLGRLGGGARRRGRSDRRGRPRPVPGAAERRGGRRLLRGLLQRHAVAAVSRRHRRARSTTGSGGPPTSRSTGVSPRPTAKVAAEGATVWVQDYQLQLVPKMLRMLRPDLTIGFFLHIPFPPVELFMQMPWRTEIVEGLLGADLIGFHLPGGAQNFLYLARRLAGQPDLPRHRRRAFQARRGAGRVPHRAGRRVPDLDRLGRARRTLPTAASSASAPGNPQANWATRRTSCSASTASTTPRASMSASPRCTNCSRRAGSIRPTP